MIVTHNVVETIHYAGLSNCVDIMVFEFFIILFVGVVVGIATSGR